MRRLIVLFILLVSLSGYPQARVAGKAGFGGKARVGAVLINPTPPMGWNNFYAFYEENPSSYQPTESKMKANTDALVSTGLSALGYNLISMDGGWSQRVSGTLQCVPAQFPSGCAALVTYIHSKGLLSGIYSSPDLLTCGSYPGSLGFETVDANTFASWGEDYLKYDACPTGNQVQYQAMGTALQATGRPFSYLVNTSSGTIDSYVWYRAVGGNINRSIGDIGSSSMDDRLYGVDWNFFRAYQNKGHWIDPDYLMCELTINPAVGGTPVSATQCQTQFTHYAILAAPLVIATDLTTITSPTLTVYSNTEVIAVNQDSRGIMGYRVSQTTCGSTTCEVWIRQLQDGCGTPPCYAVEMVNRDTGASHNITTTWAALGIAAGTWNIRDLWAHASLGSSSTGYTATAVGPFQAVLVRLTQ